MANYPQGIVPISQAPKPVKIGSTTFPDIAYGDWRGTSLPAIGTQLISFPCNPANLRRKFYYYIYPVFTGGQFGSADIAVNFLLLGQTQFQLVNKTVVDFDTNHIGIPPTSGIRIQVGVYSTEVATDSIFLQPFVDSTNAPSEPTGVYLIPVYFDSMSVDSVQLVLSADLNVTYLHVAAIMISEGR